MQFLSKKTIWKRLTKHFVGKEKGKGNKITIYFLISNDALEKGTSDVLNQIM